MHTAAPLLSAPEFPELYDLLRWYRAGEARREQILRALAAALGEAWAFVREPGRAPIDRSLPDEWTAETLARHYTDLATPQPGRGAGLRHLPSGVIFKVIPGGAFSMGYSDDEEAYFTSDEFQELPLGEAIEEAGELDYLDESAPRMRPVHRVSVRPFLLAEAPLTGAMLATWGVAIDSDTVDRLFFGKDEITYLLPDEVTAMLETCPFRLPSEAEWEYACRAGTRSLFFWGNDVPDEPNQRMNPLGLVELGNHVELCQDLWHDDYAGAPTDGSAWLEGAASSDPVVRGGAATCYPWQGCGEWQILLSAMRRPLDLDADFSADKQVAVRLARSI